MSDWISDFGEDHRLSLVAWVSAFLLLTSVGAGCQRADGDPSAAPRFEIEAVIMKGGPRLLRFDSSTGDLWVGPIVGPRTWKLIGADETSPPPQEGAPKPGRFDLMTLRADTTPLVVIKLDTITGEAWRMALPEDQYWLLYKDDY